MTAPDHMLRTSKKILASKGASKHDRRSGVRIRRRLTPDRAEAVRGAQAVAILAGPNGSTGRP